MNLPMAEIKEELGVRGARKSPGRQSQNYSSVDEQQVCFVCDKDIEPYDKSKVSQFCV